MSDNKKAIIILWATSKKIFDEIVRDISKEVKVDYIRKIYIEDYNNFIIDIYTFDNQRDLGIYKANKMCNESRKHEICVLEVSLPKTDGKSYEKIKEIKKSIRMFYMNKVDNYFHDNIMHASDSEDEYNHTLKILNKYGY